MLFNMRILVTFYLLLFSVSLNAQEPEAVIRSIFNNALTDTSAEANLRYLCKETPGRLPASVSSLKAVNYTYNALIDAGADSVWLQEVMVPHWKRGEESAVATHNNVSYDLTISTLGLSVPTPESGIEAPVIEVDGFESLRELGQEKVAGKIVFFNRPADPKLINTFASYGGAVDQRISGASEAAALGALAVIVRSPTQANHDFAHTGVLRYYDDVDRIPALTVSPHDADLLSGLVRDGATSVSIKTLCRNFPDTISYNVVGEIRGSGLPGEYITIGGHLDSWDITEGAHDDAGGCVQAIETIRLYKDLGIKPRRSVRAVMFMNEEMSTTGGKKYAEIAEALGEKHYAALESDRGVLTPLGFAFGAEGERLDNLVGLKSYLSAYGITNFSRGGGGSDIAQLARLGTLQIGIIPAIQRYFRFQHSANANFSPTPAQ